MQEQNGVEGVIENLEWRMDVVIDHIIDKIYDVMVDISSVVFHFTFSLYGGVRVPRPMNIR